MVGSVMAFNDFVIQSPHCTIFASVVARNSRAHFLENKELQDKLLLTATASAVSKRDELMHSRVLGRGISRNMWQGADERMLVKKSSHGWGVSIMYECLSVVQGRWSSEKEGFAARGPRSCLGRVAELYQRRAFTTSVGQSEFLRALRVRPDDKIPPQARDHHSKTSYMLTSRESRTKAHRQDYSCLWSLSLG